MYDCAHLQEAQVEKELDAQHKAAEEKARVSLRELKKQFPTAASLRVPIDRA